MINIVMHEPEIPQNTGNIARTCNLANVRLHLIKPLGFSLDDKYLKRAGLDYWDHLDISVYENLEDFYEKNMERFNLTKDHLLKNSYFASTKAKKIYTDVKYFETEDEFLKKEVFIFFGKETKGLPEDLILKNINNAIRIPMRKNGRSLNLANSVNIILFEVLRQTNFKNLEYANDHFSDEDIKKYKN